MGKKSKIIIRFFAAVIGLAAVFCIWYTYSWYHPSLYIKDFDSVSDDYDRIVSILYDYYDEGDFTDVICVDIDNKDFVITYQENRIDLDENEKQSLKEICETSYPGHYDIMSPAALALARSDIGRMPTWSRQAT